MHYHIDFLGEQFPKSLNLPLFESPQGETELHRLNVGSDEFTCRNDNKKLLFIARSGGRISSSPLVTMQSIEIEFRKNEVNGVIGL